MFKEVKSKVHFPDLEESVLKFWDEGRIFERSVEQRPESKTFYFYDGPPFATGMPHYGHILAGTIKDVVPRYQTMLGHRIERRFGWDCHGLPVEFEVEKELGLGGKKDIEKLGMANFNEECRSIVMRYSNEWKETVRRMGRWVDLENDYKTMDVNFMESIWWVFKTLWDKGLVYKSGKIVAYSARLTTPLSNFEVNLGYKDTQDPAITMKFKSKEEENTYFLAWTTTPWTLPSNLALTVGPEVTYAKVEFEGSYYYMAKDLLKETFGKKAEYKIIEELPGTKLENMKYEPLFPYFEHLAEEGNFIVTLGDYVDITTGTGIVHTAPMFGEDDFRTGQKYGLAEVLPMTDSGEFDESVTDFAGQFFKEADKDIIHYLKDKDLVFKHDTIVHSYPFCWRSDTPLMYRSIRTWFVNVEKIKENLLANNQEIHWQPAHIQNGRMGKWLEGARDWAISRNRYWGTTIPVWICEECGEMHCIGSKAELEEKAGVELNDLHRHFVDDLTFSCDKCSGTMRRTPEVLDCWFESGSMPYGQEHYPFENKEKFDAAFPADFISEGLDQTRGWFYTLQVLSAALFEKPAFKNCIVSGMLLAEDGKKMSKSLKNYPDPWEMINQYGADAIRLYMLNSGAIKADELRFAEKGLQETMRNNILPLWNALSFFTTYANVDGWGIEELTDPSQLENQIDRWILSQLNDLIRDVRAGMDNYDLNKSVQPFVGFIDNLTNWYIRRSRRRFWKSEQANDKHQAYMTLYKVLKELSKVIAPFIPYLAENIYSVLRTEGEPESVHLCNFPEVDPKWIDEKLDHEMELVMSAVSMGRALRSHTQIKTRQPVQSITLVSKDATVQDVMNDMGDLIKEELNVKEVLVADHEEELVHLSARPNLPALGPKYGKQMKALRPLISELTSQQISGMQDGVNVKLDLEGTEIELTVDDILIDREQKEGILVENQGSLTVALDIHLTDELKAEGFAREFVNKIQLTRKERDFDVTDRIKIQFYAEKELAASILSFVDYIQQETLADEVLSVDEKKDGFTEWDLNGESCFIQVEKL
jgi:isoleucyl-tRNA synthetase